MKDGAAGTTWSHGLDIIISITTCIEFEVLLYRTHCELCEVVIAWRHELNCSACASTGYQLKAAASSCAKKVHATGVHTGRQLNTGDKSTMDYDYASIMHCFQSPSNAPTHPRRHCCGTSRAIAAMGTHQAIMSSHKAEHHPFHWHHACMRTDMWACSTRMWHECM